MHIIGFKADKSRVRPTLCTLQVEKVLPFEHGRVVIQKGDRFNAEVKDGKTVLTVKPGAGANEAPAFVVLHVKAVREAVSALRAACCAKIMMSRPQVAH